MGDGAARGMRESRRSLAPRGAGGGSRRDFLLCQLAVFSKAEFEGVPPDLLGSNRCARHELELYGIQRFTADIDLGREFWRDGGGLVGTILDACATGVRFGEVMKELQPNFGWTYA